MHLKNALLLYIKRACIFIEACAWGVIVRWGRHEKVGKGACNDNIMQENKGRS